MNAKDSMASAADATAEASRIPRQPTSGRFITHDGEQLFYRHWPAIETRRGAIVMLHRGHEHSGRMAHLVDELDLPDFDFLPGTRVGTGSRPVSAVIRRASVIRCAMSTISCDRFRRSTELP